jgi:trk system potassium uptake protein TrkH
MSWQRLLHIVGAVLSLVGLAMAVPVGVAIIYREWSEVLPLLLGSLTTIAAGLVIRRAFGTPAELSTREAFAAVGLAWLGSAAFGALPYLVTGSLGNVTDALFESASGFTATGASVVESPGALSHGVLMWRALTQWSGGMGMVVLAIALLPLLGLGAQKLASAELPGPTAERIVPRFQETARRFWLIFVGFTAAEVALLAAADMTLFEAITHSLTTLSGGGFSTEAGSLGAFSAYAQWVVVAFMLIGGTSFALHYQGLRNPVKYARSAEFRAYLFIVLAASAFLAVGTWGSSVHDTIRNGVFTATSILTTTGFATADFGQWAAPLQILIVVLMFIGAMSGSTSGSIKVYRLEVMYGAMRAYLKRLLHRRTVIVARWNRTPIRGPVVESVRTFILLYVAAFVFGTIGLGIVQSFGPIEVSFPSTVSAVASSLGNIGPGLEAIGPTETYLDVPIAGKWILSMLMIIGRLEIVPIVILFNREAWRR